MKQHQSEGNSQPVRSSQRFIHPQLARQVVRHLSKPSRRPAAEHSVRAFDTIRERVAAHAGQLIFDSYCGTGLSTASIAIECPEALVIGIDKSAHRLQRHDAGSVDNYMLIQADCGDIWRLAVRARWQLHKHYLLYPNPWPKPGQLQRRVHGSADFLALLSLGGQIDLRSNWQTYVEEFGVALNVAGHIPMVELIQPDKPLTLFERKYLHSGHQLWRCRCDLGHNAAPLALE